jgi:hypothetical protein
MRYDDSRWQTDRPVWAYTPVMQFWKRLIETAMIDAEDCRNGVPTDRALLARAWFARPTPDPLLEPEEYATCFSFACHVLNLNEEAERLAFLSMIDAFGDYDTDECWERLEALQTKPLIEEPEELFHSFRVVPELDQMSMFA